MNEYEARIRSFASGVGEVRSVNGSTFTTLMFSLIAVLKSKDRIDDDDLETIFQVEKDQALSNMREFFSASYGDPDFEIKNEVELKDAEQYVIQYVDGIKENVDNAANALRRSIPVSKKETAPKPAAKPKPKAKKKPTPKKKPELIVEEVEPVEVPEPDIRIVEENIDIKAVVKPNKEKEKDEV